MTAFKLHVGIVLKHQFVNRDRLSTACRRKCDNGTVAFPATGLEGIVANKDKGGKSNKKAPSKNLKEKRQEKKAKRDASDKRQSKIT